MRIGDLNRRVVLQTPVRVDNGAGGTTKSFEDVATLWAQAIPLRGAAALEHSLLHSKQLWKITIRFRTGVSTDNRLMLDGQALNIQSCEDPDGRRQWLVMTCESGGRT